VQGSGSLLVKGNGFCAAASGPARDGARRNLRADAQVPEDPKILLVGGDDELSQTLVARLESEDLRLQLAHNCRQAAALLRNLRFDAILMDVKLPDGDGEQCYLDSVPYLGSTPVIFMTTGGAVEQAVRLIKGGAFDCVEKPCDAADVVARLRSALERQVPRDSCWPDPIMISPAMCDLGQLLERVAATSFNVIVSGERGSGKEVVARYMHRLSTRAGEPFVTVACANLVGGDGERLVFGESIRSSDSLNGQSKRGALEEVGRGTLFLKDIEELAPPLQGRLSQVLHQRRFRRIGDVDARPFEGRIVAATELSSAGLRERLRPNLFHRLAIVEIEVPPLRDRSADLRPLLDSILSHVAAELAATIPSIETEALAALSAHVWPGNVRELYNRILRAMSLTGRSKIGVADLFPDIRFDDDIDAPMPTLLEARTYAERQRILDALAAHGGRIGHTARALAISRVTLWGKMKRLGISNPAVPLPVSLSH
jgi:two-component system, NtrC family, response regulator HydG